MIEKTIKGIKYLLDEENLTAEVIYKRGYEGYIIIPEIVELKKVAYHVTSIGGWAFEKCSSLTSIVIPDGVTSIGRTAFAGCKSLTSIVIPDSVTSIGSGAFEGCDSLKQDPTQEIEMSNFKYRLLMHNHLAMVFGYSGCPATINIPSEINHEGVIYPVTSIGEGAFKFCKSLTSIVIPDGVTSIGKEAFRDCSSLTTSIVIPDGVTSIGIWAFYNCSSLTSIVIPDSVTSIGSGAFKGCSSLTSVVVAEGNTMYDSREQCNAIIHTATNTLIRGCQNTIIPDSVTSFGEYAFDGCKSLTSIVIPDGVTSIGKMTFYGCSSLTSIVIPNGVTSIGEWAFMGCDSLTSVVIPESVTSIGKWAFSDCYYLTSITFNGTKAQWKGIKLGYDWNNFVPAKVIHCTDGEVKIN